MIDETTRLTEAITAAEEAAAARRAALHRAMVTEQAVVTAQETKRTRSVAMHQAMAEEQAIITAETDKRQAAVLRALLSKGATLRWCTIPDAEASTCFGYELTVHAPVVVLDGAHARALMELDGVEPAQ